MNTLQLEQTRVLSASSPVLAAKKLDYLECNALRSYGQQGVLTRCQPVAVKFVAEWTPCGYQPIFKDNWSLDHDGKTLRVAAQCYWRDSFAYFDGVIHEFRNNSWKPVVPSYTADHVHIRAKFKAVINHSDQYLTMAM